MDLLRSLLWRSPLLSRFLLAFRLVRIAIVILLGLGKTTDTEPDIEKPRKESKEKVSLRGKEQPDQSEEWKQEPALRKFSRVDPDRYQASVPDLPSGTSEDLITSTDAVKIRCQFMGEDAVRSATVSEFLQFVRWFANEQSCNGTNGP